MSDENRGEMRYYPVPDDLKEHIDLMDTGSLGTDNDESAKAYFERYRETLNERSFEAILGKVNGSVREKILEARAEKTKTANEASAEKFRAIINNYSLEEWQKQSKSLRELLKMSNYDQVFKFCLEKFLLHYFLEVANSPYREDSKEEPPSFEEYLDKKYKIWKRVMEKMIDIEPDQNTKFCLIEFDTYDERNNLCASIWRYEDEQAAFEGGMAVFARWNRWAAFFVPDMFIEKYGADRLTACILEEITNFGFTEEEQNAFIDQL